ncbi:MAG: DUF523 and DUF1722 domain-containing protein [Proteobacteria bacterium]|nr:DUF523 and DUF1722 domain-containing protein [Pseudomonadota bacterium]
MAGFVRPRVVISRCLGFDRCRYDGAIVHSQVVDALRPLVDFVPICPEMEIGLGVPRNPIRVIRDQGALRLFQPATGREVTSQITRFAKSWLAATGEADGFILKSRSPSCGFKDVKIYGPQAKSSVVDKGAGFFGRAVAETRPDTPLEDEARLTNFVIRDHFLKRLFTLADFGRVKAAGRMGALVAFQARHKWLLMAYNQKELRALGRITANPAKRPWAEVQGDYEAHLRRALARTPRYTSNINVLMHGLGYFKRELSAGEKGLFLNNLEQYRAGRLPLSAPVEVMRSLATRFDNDYLLGQSFFDPYPRPLFGLPDTSRDRRPGRA